MKVEKYDGTIQRNILVGMVTNQAVLSQIAERWDGKMFAGEYKTFNLIGQWAVDHLHKYGEPPNRAIESYFAAWADKHQSNKALIDSLEKLLAYLSREYERAEEINSQYTTDQACQYFDKVRIERLVEKLQGFVYNGETDKALTSIRTFSQVSIGERGVTDLLIDQAEVVDAFEELEDNLVDYSEGLSHFFAGSLARDSFVAFIAPEKTGKTFWLIDVAWRAVLSRRRTIFFEVGDMSKRQIKRRLLTRAAGKPIRLPYGAELPYVVKWPNYLTPPSKATDIAIVEFEKKPFHKLLDKEAAWKACRRTMRRDLKSDESYFKLSVHPTCTISAAGIRSTLGNLVLEGWTPDVVVIDYADILAPIDSRKDPIQQVDATWKELRRISQEFHCLVITATQASAESYKLLQHQPLTRRHFSQSKTKMAHVTAMCGINVSIAEKEQGMCRLNWALLREGEFSPDRFCYVAGCLPLACPAVKSVFAAKGNTT